MHIHHYYNTIAQMQTVVQRLHAAAMPLDQVSFIRRSPLHNVQHERIGSYADTPEHYHDLHSERVGNYADTEGHAHDVQHERVGSYADTEGCAHDLHQAREGSFADNDRLTIQPLVTSHRLLQSTSLQRIRRLLQAAGCMSTTIDIYMIALMAGHVLVVGYLPDTVDVQLFDGQATHP